MDGMDLSAIDQIDQDAFKGSPMVDSDEESDLPMPDCIGIDSAVQDEEREKVRKNEAESKKEKTRSEIEREMELELLKPTSIRRQILERSLESGNNKVTKEPSAGQANPASHVMNIVEKAGMSGIDKERINEIIHEASKGSLFYKKQAQRQEEIHRSIERMLTKVKMATPLQVASAKISCDKMFKELEERRLMNRIIVHFDLDMFFAAVEIRDNPELADKPIAVGGDSMVSTSNYIARKFGVRAAMPGFIAKKLCPELLLIKPNGMKYRQASSEVFSVLEQYDPELTSMSLDEAYLDLTEYVKSSLEEDGEEIQEYYDGTLPKIWWTRANQVVEKIRRGIYEKTKLTCSAGVSCNTLLAKIATDINKPNGQFMIQGYPHDVKEFICKTPVGKVSGIGKVSGQFLNALDIKTCGDIYEKRHYLPLVFYEINVRFYLRVALGDGSTCIKSDEQRKSKSVERTFTAVRDLVVLLDKLDSICEELCNKYLKPYRIRGRTVTVKLKRNTFTTTTKSYSMLVPTNDKLVIYAAAKNILTSEVANEPPEISYRLLGVKISNLADDATNSNQLTIDAMLRNQELRKLPNSDLSRQAIAAPEANHPSPLSMDDDQVEAVDLVSNPPSVVDECSNSTDSSESLKRKKPDTKRMDEFFGSSHQTKKRPTEAEPQEGKPTEQTGYNDIGKVPYEASPSKPDEYMKKEQKSSNDEDFRCPYCFKAFTQFAHLENHVESCYLKIPIDVNKFLTQPQPTDPIELQPKCSLTQPSVKSPPSRNRSQNATRSQAKKQLSISSYAVKQRSSTQVNSNRTPSEKSTKMSFYQRFMESNSQILSQSPKTEPFQCPYCMHGYLSFESLEHHVATCTNSSRR